MPDKIRGTGKVADRLYILNQGFVACFIYDAGETLIAIDSGLSPRKTVAEMAKLGLDPAKVGTVLFTHSDGDHIGGVKAFPNAKLYFARDEVAMLDHRIARFFGWVYAKPVGFPYGTLEDGQSLMVGQSVVRCILTPGHTAGSMSFLIDGAILAVGDELNISKGKAVLNMKFICVDDGKRVESIRKLAKLEGVKYLCPAHSGYTDDFSKAMGDWGKQ
jgi:glyoxylase-like metal-dependent hydrolase (beta-lactamase superfamily II)